MSAEAVHYRSMSKNAVYFGKLEARARETKAENTEVRARMSSTSVNWRLEPEKPKQRIPNYAPHTPTIQLC